MKIGTMSRGRRYAFAALSTVAAAAALLAVGGANPFLDIDRSLDHSVNHDVDHNKVDISVSCDSVLDSNQIQALQLGAQSQKEKHPSGSACKDVN